MYGCDPWKDKEDAIERRLDVVENKNLDQDNAIGLIRNTMPNANVVDTLTIDVTALKDEKLDNAYMDEDIHFGPITITKDGTAVIASLDAVNPITGVVTPLSFTLPGATSTDAGVMDASSVAWITEAEARISALEGLSDVKAVVGLSATPTQTEINTAWMGEVGKAPETGDLVQDVSNAKLWVYVTDTWILYGTLVAVPLATTGAVGGIRDTALNAPANRWYGHVEADGRLSLIGGDSLSTLLDTTIPGIQSGVANAVKKSGDTMSGRLYANGGVSIEGGQQGYLIKRTDIGYNSPWAKYRWDRVYDKDDKILGEYRITCSNNNPNLGRVSSNIISATNYTNEGVAVNSAVTANATGSGETYVTASSRASPGASDVVVKSYLDTRLTAKQDKLTFDSTPITGSTNPVTSGGVYTALADKLSAFSLYEHTIRVTGTQSGGEIITFTLTVLNQSPTVFTLQTLCDYLGSASNDFKQCSGISRIMGAQMNLRYITGVRGHNETEFLLETVNPDTGSIDLLELPWTGGYTVALTDRVRQIV